MDKDYELFNISVRAKRRAQMGIDIVDGTIGMMMNDQGKAMRLPAVEAELTRCASRSQAMSAAARIIGSRALSKGELVDKLTQKGHSRENAQAAADCMEDIGAVNEGQYAKLLARHYAGRGYGGRKIQSELYRRKVPREYWAEALAEVETPEDVIDRLIEKKLRGKVPDRKELGKVSAFLAQRGFSWSQIQEGLSRYTDAQDEFEPYP